jgi:hypothetical protein
LYTKDERREPKGVGYTETTSKRGNKTKVSGEHIVRFIKSERLRLLRPVGRMEENVMLKRTIKRKLSSKIRKGRPRMRWRDVMSYLKKIVNCWKEKMRDREQWRLVVEEAKAHPGL